MAEGADMCEFDTMSLEPPYQYSCSQISEASVCPITQPILSVHPSSSSSSLYWLQCKSSPRTQTPPSCLRQPGLGRGSRFLRSSPGPLCGVSDSCQEEEKTRKEHRWTDRQTDRKGGRMGVKGKKKTQRDKREKDSFTNTLKRQDFFCSQPVNCLCCSVKNKGFVKGAFHHRRRARVR